MSRNRPVDRETAERMLRGELSHDRLSRLLAAAAAPARAGELDGEPAAVAAFQAARIGAAAPRGRSLVARLLPLKIAAATVTITAVGGVALATSTGALPTPGGSSDGRGQLSTGEMAARSTEPSPSAVRSSGSTQEGGSGPPSAPSSEEAARLADLCRGYLRGERKDTDRLAEAAGGRREITKYCHRLLSPRRDDEGAPASSSTPSTSPSPSPSAPEEGSSGPGRGSSAIVAPSGSPSPSTTSWRPRRR